MSEQDAMRERPQGRSRGRFIVLEGGEGAGKSTQAARIRAWLHAQGRQVVQTREPGGTPLAESIRAVLLGSQSTGMDAMTELLLMFAARAAHWHQLIEPALAHDHDVVCDRFTDSTYAYQGARGGTDEVEIGRLEQMVLGEQRPDLVLVLDLPPELGLQRAAARGQTNRFEAEPLDIQRRVREAFLARAAAHPRRYAVIDASGDVEAVWHAIRMTLESRL